MALPNRSHYIEAVSGEQAIKSLYSPAMAMNLVSDPRQQAFDLVLLIGVPANVVPPLAALPHHAIGAEKEMGEGRYQDRAEADLGVRDHDARFDDIADAARFDLALDTIGDRLAGEPNSLLYA